MYMHLCVCVGMFHFGQNSLTFSCKLSANSIHVHVHVQCNYMHMFVYCTVLAYYNIIILLI